MLKSDLAMMVHRRGVRTNFSTSAVNVCMPFVPPSGGNSAGDASIMGGASYNFQGAVILKMKIPRAVREGVVMKQTVYTASPESQQIHVWSLEADGKPTLAGG